ncbi:MAG TPA: hypothetical protein VKQ11_01110 [Candidatus Sulfotelmatobacter sp.]|nr:hypothetical protein [Candidatus Sulfotelmatobacter sp.]
MTTLAEAPIDLMRYEKTVCAPPAEKFLRIDMVTTPQDMVVPVHRLNLNRCAAAGSSDGKRR